MKTTKRLFICIVIAGIIRPVFTADLPEGFQQTLYAVGLVEPTAMKFAPDGRLFVSERVGKLRVIRDGQLLETPFFTKPDINNYDGRLIGIAFDPAFEWNGYVYIQYKHSLPPYPSRVSRITASANNPDVADPGSELIILEYMPTEEHIHQGEAIHFGPDGMLYVAVGDGKNNTQVQSLDTYNGKILRIDATAYPDIIPADNPFVNTPGALGEIWAIGFRNPYTFDIDKVTENMYVSDIGQHDWEEVNHVFAGENYGWPDCEGPCGDTSYVEPIYTYDHTEGCSITGAAFYRESQFPAIYEGSFFFADFCSNWIRRIDTQGMVIDFGTDVAGGPVDIQIGPDKSLYYLSYLEGAVYRIFYTTTKVQSSDPRKVPSEFSLGQNYPNPFNPSTQIQFALPKESRVRLGIYSALGERIATLVDETRQAGYYSERFDATGLASGVYFYRLSVAPGRDGQAGDPSSRWEGSGHGFVATKKLLLLR